MPFPKPLELKIPIPEWLWKNKSGEINKDGHIPSGTYRAYFQVNALIGKPAELFAQAQIGKTIYYKDSGFTLIKSEYLDNRGELMVQFYADSIIGGILILASIIGVGITGGIILSRLERVIKVSYPLIFASVGIAIFTPIGKKLVKKVV